MANEDTRGQTRNWHRWTVADLSRQLETDLRTGLDAGQVARALETHGPNVLPEGKGRSLGRMVFDQVADFMILVLIAAAVISGIIGDATDTIAIFVIVLLNAAIGVFQEYRAERAMAALRRMAAPHAAVRRAGETVQVPAHEIVPGDVVLLEAGNVVPADLRLVEAARFTTQEAALTGESHAVEKSVAAIDVAQLPIGDRRNMAFKGTLVAAGRAVGLVVATGLNTELGAIARLLASTETVKTPLQRRLTRFGTRLAIAVLAICAIVFAAGLLRGEPPVLMFLTAVSLAVAAIPEALPAVVAIALALGAYRMVTHQALIRRLPAVETLGSITTICSDKTGTLTENRMRAEAFVVDGETAPVQPPAGSWRALFEAIALCNDAQLAQDGRVTGEPTEVALLEAAQRAGEDVAMLRSRLPRVAELPFDSERKLMSTLHADGNALRVCVKGAPEVLLARCTSQWTADGESMIDDAARQELDAAAERLAAQGMRVLAVAQGWHAALPADLDSVETGLGLIGLVGLIDPPRPEARAAVDECRAAGIRPVMITGDHPATAAAIAQRLGIADRSAQVISGTELAALDDVALAARIRDVRVYARVDPAQKIRIVQALQDDGELVAMTGDGVNDAPALKRADIGVAMGRGGTDVAREAAAMVLLDDNFATIVRAVREGRRIYDNIRKFIKYTMTSNSGEIWAIFLAPFLGLPIPLLPVHILWINLVTDGLPGIMLVREPAEGNTMRRPPRPPDESIFTHGMWQHIVWVGLLMGGVSLLVQAWATGSGSAHWQSMVFTVLTLSQLGHVLAIRSERESIFTIGWLSNGWLLVVVLVTFALQMATLYVPALNPVFKTEPLDAHELLICLAASCVVFVGVEIEKWLVRHGWLYRVANEPNPTHAP
ncbi:MAG TPA: cation-translocating P-type ATPase [Rhodocyclaceae bacterium]|nr:cation-translocating P-type ATPase [Rhodocyclaceae bacterium]HMZ83343.1 cation-translocating P-type ATPase [Rhodocyclaceae bacterium]HNA03488.1 cation-translocating P-type ATPase [Rhodocyclaceae bacterium]HNB79554.1 cation-translocating P-type ATPase [Rhodocyclaceae bacterium]HNC61657.1 cation-translocating P-type ATPase [Rhodocyclaceae bacterium]